MRAVAYIFIVLLAGCGSPAQEPDAAPEAPSISENNMLSSVTRVRAGLIENLELYQANPDDPSANGWWNQAVAMLGREDMLGAGERSFDDPSGFVCEPDAPGNAIDQLVELARTHSLVIINEHHAMPGHRIFIRELALRLKGEGFSHYAAETLSPMVEPTGNAPVRTDEGYYTADPVMARLISDVRAAGYMLVPYEQRAEQSAPEDAPVEEQISAREDAQTANLIEAVLGEAPETKMIIHVGHSHVAELPLHGTPWMAARLKDRTGIDPLTISLTACRAPGETPVASTHALNARGEEKPLFTDVLVGVPLVQLEGGRPTYRAALGDGPVAVPASVLPVAEPVVIEARRKGAPLYEEPVDRLYLAPGEALPLMLPPGQYEVMSFNAAGTVAGPVEILVSD